VSLDDHPGYLGYQENGVILIHADWPMYPVGVGWQFALSSLGRFPQGTKFERIDDIDRCILFLANYSAARAVDPFHANGNHVALWHADILEAFDCGYIDGGIQRLTEYEYQAQKRHKLREEIRESIERTGNAIPEGVDPLDLIGVDIDGQWKRLRMPDLSMYEEWDEDDDMPQVGTWVGFNEAGWIRVTERGWMEFERLWGSAIELEALPVRVQKLMELEFYDTAIRELSVTLEVRMKLLARSTSYGQVVVDEVIRSLEDSGKYHSSWIKLIRADLRTCMMFVRNEFAHNVVELRRARAMAIVAQTWELLIVLNEIIEQIN
jgi:hypothetical protein